jgi:hypothetical protein
MSTGLSMDAGFAPQPILVHYRSAFMSEPIAAEIRIGGHIRQDLVPGLCKAIREEYVSLDWGDACFVPDSAEELIEGCQDRNGVRLLCLRDDQANYGTFGILEKFLVEAGICFQRHSDAKYEYDAEIIEFRPGLGQVAFASNNNGELLVPLEKLTCIATAIDKATETADGQTAVELLRRLRQLQQLAHESLPTVVPLLEAFEIVG